MQEDIIKDLMKTLEDHEKRILSLEGAAAEKTSVERKKLSIKEFLLTKMPRDDVQKTLVVGYYLEHFEGMNAFNRKDLAEGFRAAKEPAPGNINDKVNSNIRKGYMMQEKEEKDNLTAWVLTNSGEKFVEGGLSEDD